MKSDSRTTLCVICGTNVATTSDHVPPKNLFVPPRPILITVPACFDCNNSASRFDEELMIYVSLQIGQGQKRTKRLWKTKAIKALNRNKRFQREIISQMKDVSITTKSGLIVENRTAFPMKVEVYQAVFERTVRGLYFYHFKEILGNDVAVDVGLLLSLSDEAYELTKNFAQNEIGGDTFVYKYAKAAEEPKESLWVFQLYEQHWVRVTTKPKYRKQGQLDH